MMDENLDLLGDPIPGNWGKRGRPPHIPTQRNRCKIRQLLDLSWVDNQIARALRFTKATLRKHYFAELRTREEARPALEAAHLMMFYEAAQGGNVGAMKEFGRVIEKHDLARMRPPQAPKPEKLGKKGRADQLPKQSPTEGGTWSGLLN